MFISIRGIDFSESDIHTSIGFITLFAEYNENSPPSTRESIAGIDAGNVESQMREINKLCPTRQKKLPDRLS